MEDQATQLRKRVEGKNNNGQPVIQPVPPVQTKPWMQSQQQQQMWQGQPQQQMWPGQQQPMWQGQQPQQQWQGQPPAQQVWQGQPQVQQQWQDQLQQTWMGQQPMQQAAQPQVQPQQSLPQQEYQQPVHPAKEPDIAAAQMSAYSRGKARTIAITSGKGGVGKTSLAVNLAIALGAEGKRVLIIDADLGMANVDILLGTTSGRNLMDLLQNDVSLKDVILHGPYGVSYISGGSGMEHASEMTEEQRRRLFDKLIGCDEWADIILVDTGAGIGKNVLDFVAAADEVILLTTSEPTAITDAYAMMKAYGRVSKRNQMQVVVNRVYDEKECNEVMGNLSRASQKFLNIKLNCLGYVCDDRTMLNSVRKQVPLLSAAPNSVAARCIKSLAKSILNGKQEKVKLGWKGFLKKILGFGR